MGEWIDNNGTLIHIDEPGDNNGCSGCAAFLILLAIAIVLAPIVWIVTVIMIKEREKDGVGPSATLDKIHRISKVATIVIAIIFGISAIGQIITLIGSGVVSYAMMQ